MNKNTARAATFLIAFVALTACKKAEPSADAAAAPVAEARIVEEIVAPAKMMVPPAPPPETIVTSAQPVQQLASSAATYTDGERKFIRTANARFRVKDVYVDALGIEDTVASLGGFVLTNDISTAASRSESHPSTEGKLIELTEYTVQGHLIVRVPSMKTQDFLRAIVGRVVFLDTRSFAARDAQFDLLRKQLEALRNQETQADLGQVVGEGGKLSHKTEAIGARNAAKAARDAAFIDKKEFDDQVAFSTIDLTLYQPSKVLQSERIDIDRAYEKARPGFFVRSGEQLRRGWTGLQEFTLGLIGVWPALLIVAACMVLVRRLRKRRAKRTTPAVTSVLP